MHGAPPNDFPREELREFFMLHGRMEVSAVSHSPALESRYEELEDMMKNWPRTPQNDPYHAASYALAEALSAESGLEVKVGFNEFCAPSVDRAVEEAVSGGAEKVMVLTTMLTRGGEHAERDIARAVEKAKQRYANVEIVYAWPFDTAEIARFLAGHVKKFV
jgi:sirohydrochlorin cobaltochelatase